MTTSATRSAATNSLAQRAAATALRLLRGRSAFVFALDPESGDLVCESIAGEGDGEQWLRRTIPRGYGVSGLALAKGQTLRVHDSLAHPEVVYPDWARDLIVDQGFQRAVAAAPLRVEGRMVGAVAVCDRVGRDFSDDDLALLTAFADHAALALEHDRLNTRLEAQLRSARAMAEVSRELSRSLEPRAVERRVVEHLCALLGARAAAIYVTGQGDQPLIAHAVNGEAGPFRWLAPLPQGRGVAGLALAQGTTVTTMDGLIDPRLEYTPEERSRFASSPYRAILATPLVVQDRAAGVLVVRDVTGRCFGPGEVELVEGFARTAAVALHNADLYQEAERGRRQAEALAQLAATLTERVDLEGVIQDTVEIARALLVVPVAGIRLLRPDGLIESVVDHGPTWPFEDRGHALFPGRGVSGLVVQRGAPVRSADLLHDPGLQVTDEARRQAEGSGIRAFLAVPLRARERMIGVLLAADRHGREFTDGEEVLLQGFADQAALAIDRARLHGEAERRRHEAEVLADLGRAITASLDLDTVLPRIVEGARDLCGADLVRVALRDGDAMRFRHSTGTRFDGYATYRIERGRGLGGRTWADGRPRRTSDRARDPIASGDYLDLVEAEGVVCGIVVPIVIDGAVEGLLYSDRRTARPFTDADEAVLLRLAEHAAVAIRNGRLYADEHAARTALEATASALREGERRYRDLVENASDIVYTHDMAGIITSLNRAGERISGYRAKELVGRSISEVLPPEQLVRVRQIGASLETEGPPPVWETEIVTKDSRRVALEVSLRVMFEDGRRVGIQGIARDVTERRALEDQLRQAQKMEAVGRLAGGIAHDFNNLLTVIGGRVELLLATLEPEHPARQDVELVQRAADRAAELTARLLAFSRKQVLQPRVLDLNDIVVDLEPMLRRLIGEDVRLDLSLDRGVPPVTADPSQLEQVVMNLAVNARDAMPEGGRLGIATWAAPAGAGAVVVLEVSDTGLGMDLETRARLFEPFFTTKEPGRGTGLGLATVYGIVTQSGGRVAVESTPGGGTRFRVLLPPASSAPSPLPAELARGSAGGGWETVLVVEDEADVRSLAAELLSRRGYTVLSAEEPGAALALAREHGGTIHLLLTDVVMPGMSGPDLAALLAAVRPHLRVLYMSGYTDDALGRHGVLGPGIALLPKPFSAEVLARRVREALDAAPGA